MEQKRMRTTVFLWPPKQHDLMLSRYALFVKIALLDDDSAFLVLVTWWLGPPKQHFSHRSCSAFIHEIRTLVLPPLKFPDGPTQHQPTSLRALAHHWQSMGPAQLPRRELRSTRWVGFDDTLVMKTFKWLYNKTCPHWPGEFPLASTSHMDNSTCNGLHPK